MKKLDEGLSLWLDLVRVVSALVVVLYHASAPQLGGGWFRMHTFGVDAVMVFFVLSGFVIAYIEQAKEDSAAEYIAARLARLWSVLLPALLLTLILDPIGRYIDPKVYEGWDGTVSEWPLSLLPSTIFLNELWFKSIPPLSNGPVWSTGFEFWYYVIFAASVFTRGWRRLVLLALLALIVGPRILLLLPVWLLGVVAFRIVARSQLPTPAAAALFFGPFILLIGAYALRLNYRLYEAAQWVLGKAQLPWGNAAFCLWGLLLGSMIAAQFIGAAGIGPVLDHLLSPLRASIRGAAGVTFSIYLFHNPLLLLVSAALNGMMSTGLARTFTTVVVTLAVCCALGLVFEPRRHDLRGFLLDIARRRASKT